MYIFLVVNHFVTKYDFHINNAPFSTVSATMSLLIVLCVLDDKVALQVSHCLCPQTVDLRRGHGNQHI